MLDISTRYEDINKDAWAVLVARSPWATWFQTPEAYLFYAALPDEMHPFVASVTEVGELTGVIVGYLTQEKSALKQFFTRRAIIIGGPLLDEHISPEALTALLLATEQASGNPIYIETRNFHDYGRFRDVFETAGWTYKPHLNFHVNTTSVETIDANLGKNRKRDIRVSKRDGATIIEKPTIEQVRTYYAILQNLYATKVKTPLFSWRFFETLYAQPNAHFLLVEYEGKIQGGTVCVGLKEKALYEWFVCGLDGRYKTIFPSEFATYSGLCYAAENGYPIFDMMGAGTPNETYGVRDFKARFGGKLVEHGRYQAICKPLLYRIGELGVKLLKHSK
ncbi:MAG: lipid II:glycine glycyltransferase FemX [Paludibacteraceae bacterium]